MKQLRNREAALRRPVSTRAALTGVASFLIPAALGVGMAFGNGMWMW